MSAICFVSRYCAYSKHRQTLVQYATVCRKHYCEAQIWSPHFIAKHLGLSNGCLLILRKIHLDL